MRARLAVFLTAVLIAPAAASAQNGTVTTDTLAASSKALFGIASDYITRSAEKMPAENYAWRPTPEVRTFGQLIAHIADGQYIICSRALGEKPPVSDIEKTKTTKSELVQALAGAFDYCGRAHTTLGGAKGAEITNGPGGKHPRIGVLYFNSMHTFEHYGNVITYLRLKGIVPPSSEPRKPASSQ